MSNSKHIKISSYFETDRLTNDEFNSQSVSKTLHDDISLTEFDDLPGSSTQISDKSFIESLPLDCDTELKKVKSSKIRKKVCPKARKSELSDKVSMESTTEPGNEFDDLSGSSTQIPDKSFIESSTLDCDTELKNVKSSKSRKKVCPKAGKSELSDKVSMESTTEPGNELDTKYFFCSCRQRYASIYTLGEHARRCHVAKFSKLNCTYTCLKCVLCFDDSNQLNDHLSECLLKPDPIVKRKKCCKLCPRFEIHFYRCVLKDISSPNWWKCSMCSKEFTFPLDCFVHSRICQGKQLTQCLCEENFDNAFDFYKHAKFCGTLNRKLLLLGCNCMNDLDDDQDDDLSQAQITIEKRDVRKVTRQSNPKKEISCNSQSQGDKSKGKNKLRKHIMLPSITEEKMIKYDLRYDKSGCIICPLCGNPYNNLWYLKQHHKGKHLPPKFSCKKCNIKFSWKTSLMNHQNRCLNKHQYFN